MPVTRVSNEACIKFVKGSHLSGVKYFPRAFRTSQNYKMKSVEDDVSFDGTSFDSSPDLSSNPQKYELLSWDVEVSYVTISLC